MANDFNISRKTGLEKFNSTSGGIALFYKELSSFLNMTTGLANSPGLPHVHKAVNYLYVIAVLLYQRKPIEVAFTVYHCLSKISLLYDTY